MKISELIKALEKVKAEHGDLEVGIVDVDTSVSFAVGVCKSVYCEDFPEKFEPDTELKETPYCEIELFGQ